MLQSYTLYLVSLYMYLEIAVGFKRLQINQNCLKHCLKLSLNVNETVHIRDSV